MILKINKDGIIHRIDISRSGITFEQSNDIFSDEVSKVFSFQITYPKDAPGMEVFAHYFHLCGEYDTVRIPGILEYYGSEIPCDICIEEDMGTKIAFSVQYGGLPTAMMEQRLQDLMMDKYESALSMTDWLNTYPGDGILYFPEISAPKFYENTIGTEQFKGDTNSINATVPYSRPGENIKYIPISTTDGIVQNNNAIIGCVSLSKTLESACAQHGFTFLSSSVPGWFNELLISGMSFPYREISGERVSEYNKVWPDGWMDNGMRVNYTTLYNVVLDKSQTGVFKIKLSLSKTSYIYFTGSGTTNIARLKIILRKDNVDLFTHTLWEKGGRMQSPATIVPSECASFEYTYTKTSYAPENLSLVAVYENAQSYLSVTEAYLYLEGSEEQSTFTYEYFYPPENPSNRFCIDTAKCLPDIRFADLYRALKNKFNLSLLADNAAKTIRMFFNDAHLAIQNSDKEFLRPKVFTRTYRKDEVFVFHDANKNTPVLEVSHNKISTFANYEQYENESTTDPVKIESDLYPLINGEPGAITVKFDKECQGKIPIFFKKGIYASASYEDSEGHIYKLEYPALYDNFWKFTMIVRMNAQLLSFDTFISHQQMQDFDITERMIIFGKQCFITDMERTLTRFGWVASLKLLAF